MVTVDEFSRLVSGIYAAATAPQHWERALRDIHHTMGGTGGALMMADGAIWSVQNSVPSEELIQSYAQHYARLDHVLATVVQGPVGVVRTGTELIHPYQDTEFHVGWIRPNDVEDGVFVRLNSGCRPTCFSVAAPRRSEAFDTPERVKLMKGLVPHVQQALRTQDKLAALGDSAVELAGVLEVVRYGVVIVAAQHRVINLNSAAERIVRAEDGLCMRSGRIAATSMRADQELQCALENALTGERSTVRTGRSLTCSRPSGQRSYVIHVLPSHRRDANELLMHPMALVLIIDPEDQLQPPGALLRRLYHLTEAEADVAVRVVHGADLKEISDQLSISLATVRTHLQHVFDKTSTHRQADLVRLLLVLNP